MVMNFLALYSVQLFPWGTNNARIIERVERSMLDEDQGRGAIGRAKGRRDRDEIYVRGQMQVWTQIILG